MQATELAIQTQWKVLVSLSVATELAIYTVGIVLVSLSVEILAVDENCVAPNDDTPIENFCDLKKPAQFAFGETTGNSSLKSQKFL